MKALLWTGTGLVALLWTLMVAIMASLANWLVGSADQAVGGLQTMSQWPMPAWLSLWMDPALLEPIKAMVVWGMDALATATPWLTPLLAWVAPLLWVVWALVMLLLIVIAVGGHLLASKLGRSNSARL
ncbi:MAG: hypothetical protein KJ614_15070 [Gammaproteobacteria bacterium]|uniref:hypothetical protein n=1 Tax=Rhodoferax sp. TaxID=50421 RepID=UPI001790FD79|nr:hypothetical protein [Rhodoferax sp.]MBU3900219.1 hypothetical protein [Gammaproteobacteria bacterium]MBA3058797.1 hypothetical protein [Rhodoferax sp.]MBU3999543.1 hypothetical protein [Gammaproteobacteria bacterium]MBU4082283.1 hypothetical protein [Gammaproteobacteria bacterium]MBU4114156.1 hypothetical protein [Gammaproteobacteria bacterium]